MSIPEHAATVEMTVPFSHCDPLFVVWHGRYFEYFGVARSALLKKSGLDVPDVRDMGLRMFVTDVRCRYAFPLTYGDQFRVTAWLTDGRPLLRVAYEMFNITQGRRAARASTTIATTDGQGNLLSETPDEVFERLPAEVRARAA